ncbi:type II toxin-antitoxin system RelE/ParE family toxin [Arhodomonas sp. SL1]|uniref:type II toxin-antitoxin system RelE/ParE family toxin n=1 Tax=Arhodomonas sp. SL1 TaxID=3425691 RepID=UPI003F8830A6
MAELNWTAEAQWWLEDIYRYVARDNPAAAADLVEGIYQRAQVLADFPQIGYRYEALPTREIRVLLYGHYRIAYLIKADDSVDILGIFHGAMEIERYII